MRKYKIGPDIDLEEEVVRDGQGKRITKQRAEEMAEHALQQVRRGRPSLTGGRHHSPRISFRVPEQTARQATVVAERQGRTVSQLGREALERYLESVR